MRLLWLRTGRKVNGQVLNVDDKVRGTVSELKVISKEQELGEVKVIEGALTTYKLI